MPRPYPAARSVVFRFPRPRLARIPRRLPFPEAQLRAGAKKPRAGEGGTPEGRGPGWPEFTSPVSGGAQRRLPFPEATPRAQNCRASVRRGSACGARHRSSRHLYPGLADAACGAPTSAHPYRHPRPPHGTGIGLGP